MYALRLGLPIICLALALAAQPAAAAPRSDATTLAVIEAAREAGAISAEEAALLTALSLREPERLPAEYRGAVVDKCGTPATVAVQRALPELSRDAAEQVRDLRARPTCTHYYDTTHFRIHYDIVGTHAILGWPDTTYRDAVAAALENCWAQEVTTLGFRQPPGDGFDPDGGGGSSHYDVYLQNLSGYYGYCQGMYTVPSTPTLTDCTSYVVIDNDYAGFGYPDPQDPMKVTVAHEFCHACQYASDYLESVWYMECTSTWVEDYVYDTINDYRNYISYFYSYPYASLDWNDGTGLRMYGSCVWDFYIAETLGPAAVRAVWSAAEGTGSTLTVLNSALGSYGTSLADAFEEFAVWSWFTGTRSDGAHFSEGGSWPLVSAERTYSTLPVVAGGPTVAHRPDHLAFNFIHINNPGGTQDVLDVSYDGPAPMTTSNHASVCVKTTGGATSERTDVALDPAGAGSASVAGWNLLSQACLVVVNSSTATNDMDYTVAAERTTPVEITVTAAEAGDGGVVVRWTLETAGGVAGLSVWRATAAGEEFVRLNGELLGLDSPGSFLDADVRPGDDLWYRLVATGWDGSETAVGEVVRVRVSGAAGLALSPPMPNPLRDSASFELTVPVDGARVALRVFDLSGRLVATVADEWMDRGRRTRSWDGRDDAGRAVAAGVYFGALEVEGAVVVQKVTVLR
jgi:hypothetical protein